MFFRKFLAALVLALHVTPGRRLLATVEKYSRCGEFLNPPDGFVKALLDLLSGAGWSNSLEDVGTAVGLPKDNTEDFLNIATVGVLRAIVDKLMQSGDFKVRDMAMRHEINLEIKTSYEGDCSHNSSSLTSERAVALSVSGGQGETQMPFTLACAVGIGLIILLLIAWIVSFFCMRVSSGSRARLCCQG